MRNNWYQNSFPTIKESESKIALITDLFPLKNGVKGIMAWGSYARNIDNPNFRVKDIDIIIKTTCHSEDLVSITKDAFAIPENEIEDNGFDITALKISKKASKITDSILDLWALSSDKKLLHWGPMASDKEESDAICLEAQSFAEKEVGVEKEKISRVSQDVRNSWYQAYKSHYMSQLKNMPFGWYCSESDNIEDILKQAIDI